MGLARNTDSRLLGFMFVTHLLVHAVILSIPLFVPLWLSTYGVSRYTVGLVVTLMVGLYGVLAVPAGVLSDRWGAHQFIVLFLAGTGIACILVVFVDRFLTLAIVLAFIGAFAGLYHSPVLSLISRQAETPATAFGYHGLGANVGVAGGPVLVTIALTKFPWEQILAMFSLPLLATAIVFYRFGPTDTTYDATEVAGGTSLRDQIDGLLTVAVGIVLLMYVFRGLYYRGALTFLPDFIYLTSTVEPVKLFGTAVPASRWIYSAILLAGAVGQVGGGYLGNRIGVERALFLTFLATSVLILLVGRTTSSLLLPIGLVFGVILFVVAPLLQALVATYTPHASRGMGYGVIFGFNHGIGAFGAVLVGWVATAHGYGLVFPMLAAIPLGGVLTVVALKVLARS